jgi:hypothetical protein
MSTNEPAVTDESSDWSEQRTNRRSFIRKLGTFAAVGVAAVMLPAQAKAGNAVCCPNDCFRPDCQSGQVPFNCQDSCSGRTCCVCFSVATNCLVKPCLC